MRLERASPYRFDRFLPIFNWLYPLTFGGEAVAPTSLESVSGVTGRALYFHVPFCETICTFCPFVRSPNTKKEDIDAYVRALITEVRLKGPLVNRTPIRAIFVGGGTPSLLSPEHFAHLGAAIADTFDLSQLKEFSIEFEVKSASSETAQAAASIGATHARFGLQTFSKKFRDQFELTASIDDIYACANVLTKTFPNVSCDLLFGMHGQTEEELHTDLRETVKLGLRNIDVYPLNNVVIQTKLQRSFDEAGARPLSGLTKHYMRQFVRAYLESENYAPHNGHGYVRAESPIDTHEVVSDRYSFIYHEHVYGYENFDVIAFGVNGVSSTRGFHGVNDASRSRYVRRLSDGELPCKLWRHPHDLDAVRPIALALPYHGRINQTHVDWSCVDSEVSDRLAECREAGLVHQEGDCLALTRCGWDCYSNLMYYLLPASERRAIDSMITRESANTVRELGDLTAPVVNA